jgi:hypothetical protein
MDDKELRELLEHLHGEIEHTKTVDDKGQELLRDLNTDIRDLLERSEADRAQSHPSIIQRLDDSIDYLQVTHPSLSILLSKLLETLSNAGI